MGRAVACMSKNNNIWRAIVGKPEGERPLGRLRCGLEDKIKMDLREVG
jgi:hypothetical protein